MKKLTFIFTILAIVALNGNAQKKEGLGFFSDRDVYVSGETLLAKIFTPEENQARIVYIDLVNLNSVRITGISLEIKNHQADGFLQLPDTLSSGTYLVRAYLKNTAEKLKIIREIWISNRFDGLEKISLMSRMVDSNEFHEKRSDQIKIGNVGKEYQTNSNIEATIKIDEMFLKEIDGNILVSVAQTDSSFESSTYLWNSENGKEGMEEKKGIIISGTITDKRMSQLATDIMVYLTIPDSIPGFQYYKTGSDGRFYFLLDNYYGSVQAFVQCFSKTPTQRLKITIDEFFSQPGVIPRLRQQPISEEMKSSINRNIEAVTFQKIFGQVKLNFLIPEEKKNESYPYYGLSSYTSNPQLFIDLPNFSEISKELLPGVKFRNYNNEPTLQVIDNGMNSYFDENPLILIDGIPISDLNVIKDMGTSDIKLVEVCQSERFYGDLRFPGVVAIYTIKADYSRIPISDQFLRLKLDAIQVPCSLAEPVITESTIPDLRQVLFWSPMTEPKGNVSVKCRTSSILGQFKLVVRGKLKNGTLFFAEKQFEVNQL